MEVGAAAPPEIEFAPLIDGECISPGFQGRLRVVELYRESGPFWESVRDMCARWEIEAHPQLQANGPGMAASCSLDALMRNDPPFSASSPLDAAAGYAFDHVPLGDEEDY